jgi:hypothetical protein
MDVSSPTVAKATTAGPAGDTWLPSFVRLGVRLAILASATLATITAIVFLVPEKNDYSLGIEMKHRRLAQIGTRKIVLIGGSNLSYGVDSKQVRQITGCPVVNMGMNGYFGVRYMLEEVKAHINSSDVVVLSFEYDNLYKSVDGTPSSHLAIIKAYPSVFSYLSPEQKLKAVAAIPVVAQAKVMRLISELIAAVKRPITGKSYRYEGPADMNIIESLESFTPEGDIVAHLGIEWPFPREEAVVPKGATIDREMVSLMRGFAEEMQKRGVPVVVSYTPFLREAYTKLQSDLAQFDSMVRASPPLIVPSPPSAFVYDGSLFFDTVYHLNERGRPLRTQKLADDLLTTLRERARCP